MIYTRNSTCAPIRAEEGITGALCPPGLSVPFRNLPKERQIGGYPTIEQLASSDPSPVDKENEDENENPNPRAPERIDAATLDSEGRTVVLEFPAFVLVGVYCPAYRDESRDCFRMDFLNALDARIRNLVAMGKRVFVTGDINIARGPIDAAHAVEGIRKGTTTEEQFASIPSRKLFNELFSGGNAIGEGEESRQQPVLHDICRSFHPDRAGMYTCWDTRLNTRPGNYGSRIDYVLCSLAMQDWFLDSNIQEGLMVPFLSRSSLNPLTDWTSAGLRPLSRLRRFQATGASRGRVGLHPRYHESTRRVQGGKTPARILVAIFVTCIRAAIARV